jgi:hypothetical protein
MERHQADDTFIGQVDIHVAAIDERVVHEHGRAHKHAGEKHCDKYVPVHLK